MHTHPHTSISRKTGGHWLTNAREGGQKPCSLASRQDSLCGTILYQSYLLDQAEARYPWNHILSVSSSSQSCFAHFVVPFQGPLLIYYLYMNSISGSCSRETELWQVCKGKYYMFTKKSTCLRKKEWHGTSTIVGHSVWKETTKQSGWLIDGIKRVR